MGAGTTESPTMCSRYFLDADGNIIAFTFQVPVHDRIRKRFNIAPTQEAPVVRAAKDGGREAAMLRWGLVPFWAKDLKIGSQMINARAETVAEKPAFRHALQQRRCLIPATGFFEWKGEPGKKQAFAITVPDRPLFAFAGLWERWKPKDAPGDTVETFTIVTTDANDRIARIHDRMPVILPMDAIDTWLTAPLEEARALLAPWAGEVDLRAVGRHVSNVNHEGPECLADAEAWSEAPAQGRLL
jgi:putative SOS response-associated peptidase YedK